MQGRKELLAQYIPCAEKLWRVSLWMPSQALMLRPASHSARFMSAGTRVGVRVASCLAVSMSSVWYGTVFRSVCPRWAAWWPWPQGELDSVGVAADASTGGATSDQPSRSNAGVI